MIALHARYLQKEIGFVAKFFSKYFFGGKGDPELYVFISSRIHESTKVVGRF